MRKTIDSEGELELTAYGKTLLAHYTESLPLSGFTACFATYGERGDEGHQILTKEAVMALFKDIGDHPEQAEVTWENVRFRVKSLRLEEETPSKGRLMVEYVRK